MEIFELVGKIKELAFTPDQLGILWKNLVELSPFTIDQEGVYKLLNQFSTCLPSSVLVHTVDFFTQNIQNTDPETFTAEGFKCYISYFLIANEVRGVLRREKQEGVVEEQSGDTQKWQNNEANTGDVMKSYSFRNKKKQTEDENKPALTLLTSPENLEGLDAIWNIATSNRNP